VFVSYKVIPPYFANYQLEDWLKTQIPFLMVNHTTDDALYASIIKEMHSEGIDITKDNIKIVQNNANGINVQISYDVKLDLMVYQATLHFTPQMNSQSLVQ
jgi:ribosome-interacting GTPase 1